MKSKIRKISGVLLSAALAGGALTCCAFVTTALHNIYTPINDNPVPVPVSWLKFEEYDDSLTLLGFQDDVDVERIHTSGCNVLDLDAISKQIPKPIKKIAPYAFASVFNNLCPIKTLTLPQGLEEIGQAAFYFSPSFTNQLFIPDTVKVIGQDAFNYAAFTGDLKIPQGVEKIDTQAFWHIDTLTGKLTIPSSVKEVGFRAFKGLDYITELDLSSYERIPAWLCKQGTIFQNVGDKGDVQIDVSTMENTSDEWTSMLKRQGVAEGSIKVNAVSDKPTEENCFKYEDAAHEIITGFADGFDFTRYTLLQFPSKVKKIKENAFENKITTHKLRLDISNLTVTELGDNAFKGCYGLTCNNPSIPSTITSFGNSVFENCTGITGTITWPDVEGGYEIGKEGKGNDIFKGCTGITGLVVKQTDKFLGSGVFQNCSSLAYIDITDYKDLATSSEMKELWAVHSKEPSKHRSWGGISRSGRFYYSEDALVKNIMEFQEFFAHTSDIDSTNVGMAVVDESKRTDWQVAFYPRTEDPIPDMDGFVLKNIEECCGVSEKYKHEVNKYNTIAIPDVVTSIGTGAFKDLLKPTRDEIDRWELKLNLGIHTIKDSAFENCDGIVNNLYIPSTTKTIGNKAFLNCSNIVGELRFPFVTEFIGDQSFSHTRAGTLFFNKNMKHIGAKAFANSKYIKQIDLTAFDTFPKDIYIGEDAFKFTTLDTDPSYKGVVCVHKGTSNNWKDLLEQKGLSFDEDRWVIKEVE